ncbi:MAG TPA: cyclophilin-like fold protein [Steroidobacteraceae bacterium]|nr:cyclophilin-like fold protein [Steroidobacteraceae bacterium]
MTSSKREFPLLRMQRWFLQGLSVVVGLLVLNGCKAGEPAMPQDAAATFAQAEEHRMWMIVGEHRFAITLANSDGARALAAQLPLTLQMAELNGNEMHADLSQALPTDASRPGTIHNGDLMLYGSNTLVVFYKTFRSSYSYTRLGRVNDPARLEQVLGQRSVRIVFSKD